MSNFTVNGTTPANVSIPANGEAGQVHGQTAFWAILAVALNAMAQTSIFTDMEMGTEGMFGGGLYPQMSSPILCGVDAFMELGLLLPLMYQKLNARIAKTLASQSTAAVTTADHDSAVVSSIRQLVSVRVVLFVFAVLPQAIKVYAMTGVPALQAVTTLFLAAPLVRIISTLCGRDFEDQKQMFKQRSLNHQRGDVETTEQAGNETAQLEKHSKRTPFSRWTELLRPCNVLAHAYAYLSIWYEVGNRIDLSGTIIESFLRSSFFKCVGIFNFFLFIAWVTGIFVNRSLPAKVRWLLRWSPIMTIMIPLEWLQRSLRTVTLHDCCGTNGATKKDYVLTFIYTTSPPLFAAYTFSLGVATILDKLVGFLCPTRESKDAGEQPPMIPVPIATEVGLGAHALLNQPDLTSVTTEMAILVQDLTVGEGSEEVRPTINELVSRNGMNDSLSAAPRISSEIRTDNALPDVGAARAESQINIQPWPVSNFLDSSCWLYEVRPVRKMIRCGIFVLTIPPKTIPLLISFWLESTVSSKEETEFSSNMTLSLCLSISGAFRSFRTLIIPALAAAWDGNSVHGLQDGSIIPPALVRALEPIAGCPLEPQQQQQEHRSAEIPAQPHLNGDWPDGHGNQFPRQDKPPKTFVVVHPDATARFEAACDQSNNRNPNLLPPRPSSETTKRETMAPCGDSPHSVRDRHQNRALDARGSECKAKDPDTRSSRRNVPRSTSPEPFAQLRGLELSAEQAENNPASLGASDLSTATGDVRPDCYRQIKTPAEIFFRNMNKSLDFRILSNRSNNTAMYVVYPRGYFDPRINFPGNEKHNANNKVPVDEEAQTIKRRSVLARLGQVILVFIGASLLFLAQLFVLTLVVAISAFSAHGVVRIVRPVWNKIDAGSGGRRSWVVFAIFNLCTTVVYCAVVFDGTNTICPSWTDLFG